jgi:hypothetical protein
MGKISLFTFLLFTFVSQSQTPVDTFLPRGIGGGGALFFPTINPANDNEYYVSCDMSELFHTKDFGKSYTQIHHKSLQVFNTSTYEFTNNPLIAYSNFNDGNSGYPVKTIDGGKTWNMLAGHNGNNGQAYRVIANYNNPLQVIVGYFGDIFISNDGGTTLNLIHHNTNNGAGLILSGAFFDGINITIGTNEGLFKSSNGGGSFVAMTATGMTSGQVIWNFRGAKSGSTTRYTCIAALDAVTYNGIMPYDNYQYAQGVYTMDNNSGTWIPKSTGINFTNDFVMYVGMADNDVNTIYLGGKDNITGGPLVYKSSDGGINWAKVFKTTNNQNIITGWSGAGGDKGWSWGETCFGITVAPNNSQKVIFPDFSFVHVSSDGGANWTQAYVNPNDENPPNTNTPTKKAYHSIGLENTTAWQMFWVDSQNVFAAFSDIGAIRSKDGGRTWGFQCNGLGVNSTYRFAKAGTNLYAGTSRIHDMYQSTRLTDAQLDAFDNQGLILFSMDKGDDWSTEHTFSHPVFWIAVDPNNANKMYASVIHYGGGGAGSQGGIWMTSNLNAGSASTWTKLSNPPRTEGHPASIIVLNDGKVLCTYSGRYTTTFTASSGVFLYDPGTSTWSDKSDVNMQYWTKDIIIDPSDATQNTWYACVFSGWGGSASGKGGVYRTTNRGTSWTKLSASLFDRVTSITFDPNNNKHIYLTTETQGLWESQDISQAVPSFTLVNAYPFRQPERVYYNPFKQTELWVTSFGNGIKMGASTTIQGIALSGEINSGWRVYPNPAFRELRIENGGWRIMNTGYAVYDVLGQRVLEGTLNGKETIVNISSLTKGIYFVRVGDEARKVVKIEN